MSYKKAAQQKLRVQTSRGLLSAEELYDLPIPELDVLAVALQAKYEQSGAKSFLETKSLKDKIVKLQFDIVLDILETKVKNAEIASKSQETKTYNQKIEVLIEKKKEGDLAELSVEELESLLKK